MATKAELEAKIAKAKNAIKNPNATAGEKVSYQRMIDKATKDLAELGGSAAAPAAGGDSAEIKQLKDDIKTQKELIKEGGLPPNIEASLKKKLEQLENKLAEKEGKAAPAKPAEKKERKKREPKSAKVKKEKPAKKEVAKPAAKPKRKPPVKAKLVAKHKRISPKAEAKKPAKKHDKYSGLSKEECLKRLAKAEKANASKRKDYKERKAKGLPAAKTPAEIVSKASKSVAKKVKEIVKKKGEITKIEADKTKMKIADIVEVIVKAIPEKKDKVEWLKELCGAVLKRVKINPKDFKMA